MKFKLIEEYDYQGEYATKEEIEKVAKELGPEVIKYKDILLDSNPSKFKTLGDRKLGLTYDYENEIEDDWAFCNLCYNIYNKDNIYVGGVALRVYDTYIKIQCIVILPKYRKLSYGHQAIEALKRTFPNMKFITNSVPSAIKFWERNNFDMDDYKYSGTYYGELNR